MCRRYRTTDEATALAGIHAEEQAALAARLLRRETLATQEVMLGEVWMSAHDGDDVEHIVVDVPIGDEVARFEFGDPNYVSDVCHLEEWADGEPIGWVQVTGVPFRPKVGSTIAGSVRRSVSVIDDQGEFVCSLPAGRSLPVRGSAQKKRGVSGFWVPIMGEREQDAD